MAQDTHTYNQAARFKNRTAEGVVYDAVEEQIYSDIDAVVMTSTRMSICRFPHQEAVVLLASQS